VTSDLIDADRFSRR